MSGEASGEASGDSLSAAKSKLRKTGGSTDPVKDRSAPNIKGIMSDAKVNEYYESVLDVNLERWIDSLEAVTFPTDMIPLSQSDAALIIAANADLTKRKSSEPDQKFMTQLIALTVRVGESIDRLRGGAGGAVFVKLSCRSPKDKTSKSLSTQYYKYLIDRFTHTHSPPSDNDKLIALLKANTAVLPCYTAIEAITRIVKSDRISEDLAVALDKTHVSRYEQHIAVRKWYPHGVDSEFRGLVCGGELNCLTQYNYIEFFERIPPNAARIGTAIKHFYDTKCKHKLLSAGFKDFVIDFVVVEKPHPASLAAQPPIPTDLTTAATATTTTATATATATAATAAPSDAKSAPDTKTAAPSSVAVASSGSGGSVGSVLKIGLTSRADSSTPAPTGSLAFSLDEIYVIEINPWGPSTDCGLFDFKTESEGVMRSGPFELRVRSSPAVGIKDVRLTSLSHCIIDARWTVDGGRWTAPLTASLFLLLLWCSLLLRQKKI